ncbi:MAG: DUF6398 domain-containing protein [Actinomycetota bacterium]|nr:DUF6398 domain-containing protein [Actinomycetota bacterium]
MAWLDEEYAFLCRQLVVRLARSPLVRGNARIWAAGAIHAINLGPFEPELTRSATLEQHPLAWLVEIEGSSSTPACCQPTCRTRLGAAA